MMKKNIKSRRELEDMKDADRMYSRFEQEAGVNDPEFEKEMDRIIEEKMAKGFTDD